MQIELDEKERRALRRRARTAVLDALEALGGEAQRHEVLDRAVTKGGFGERELGAPPPASGKYERLIDYELSWALTNLKRDGLVENPRWSIWRLADAGAQDAAPVLAEQPRAERLAELREMPYATYLRTPEWRKTRAAALLRAGYSCSLDVAHTENLEVHHRTYERRGAELETDLIVLCQDCHRAHHVHNGRPGKPRPAAMPRSVPSPAPPKAPRPTGERSRRGRADASTLKRQRAQNAARELIFQLFALSGFVVGVLMGFAARPRSVAPCHVDDCIAAGMVAQLMPIVLYAFGGVMLGGLVGVVLALRVRLARNRR